MQKRFFPVVFAAVMLAMVMPFFPTVLAMQDDISAAEEAFDTVSLRATIQSSHILRQGYVGSPLSTPVPSATARLQGVAQPDAEVSMSSPTIEAVFAQAAAGRQDRHDTTLMRTAAVSPSRGYEALEVARSAEVINLNPGQAITVWVDFKNVGSATWTNSGANFVAMNVTDPAGRESAFRHRYWPAAYRPAKMLTTRVRPGEVGRFRFALQAPTTTGVYTESFQLVAEHLTWIPGSQITIPIGVGEKVSPAPHWQAEQSVQSASGTIKMAPGSAGTFSLSFTNTGTVPWFSTGTHYVAMNVTDPAGRTSVFRHKFWRAAYQPARLLEPYVRPGENGTFRFALQAPTTEGIYHESFQLVAEHLTWIPGSSATLTIQVGNPLIGTTPTVLVDDPDVRIGLFTTSSPVQITADGAYEIWDGTAARLATVSAGSLSTVTSSSGTYTVTNGATWSMTGTPRFVPTADTVVMQIASYANRPSWNTSLNDNTFRGVIEVRYVAATNETWVINELPLESYLRGVAESSNGSSMEYLKALAIAQRSYTLWHYLNGGKYKTAGFTINATTDQIYRGYGFEARSTDPKAAVMATTGQVITHPSIVTVANPQGVAFAPYSSGSDGRTRSWSEVWAGSYPWLVSVQDPYGVIPNAHTLSGNHMVGMSAKGALGYAQNGMSATDILAHYYTGTTLITAY